MTLEDSVGEKWQELSGQNYWKGLIDPLNIDFRRYIIHYGEMAQATYDAFNTERASKYAGSCLYRKSEFFEKVDLKHGKLYTVTKFLYATSSIPLIPDIFMVKSFSREAWSKESNWIGYVAVATDEGKEVLGRRDIVIAWRGTVQNMEWVNDLQFVLLPAPQVFPSSGLLITSLLTNPKVHQGWYNIYTSSSERSPFNQTSVREQATSEVQRLVKLYKGEEVSITITGHSLGAAVATLNAVDIVANGFNKGAPVSAFVFASPGVGDINFKRVVSEYKDLRIFRIENVLDIVPKYPPLGYFNVGEGLMINTQKSGYLKLPGDITSWHSLEAYLHGVAGTQGASIIIGAGEFKLDVDRDIALVNKSLDALKDEYLVPASWWVLKNKGMTKQSDGTWKLEENKEDKEDCF